MEQVYTVSGLTEEVRKGLERSFPYVWVRGEVTNMTIASSGHIYFSLKDSASQLQCVWFAGKYKNAGYSFDPLTGEVYDAPLPPPTERLKNGLEILASGGIGVYAARGQYQLIVDFAQPAGVGVLAMEFEKIKAKLAALGYFAAERKRLLPRDPERVALITSARGAAIHDFMEVASDRGLSSRVRLFNVPVQGKDAAAKIAEAINLANEQAWAEVVVIIRGGGSLEDLWAFNEEAVAEAIFRSNLPVLTGIGHEIDTSIADMVADLRGATPSHAAQLLWTPRRELWQRLDELVVALSRLQKGRTNSLENILNQKARLLELLSPEKKLETGERRLRELSGALRAAVSGIVRSFAEREKYLEARMAAIASPRGRIEVAEKRLDALAGSLAGAFDKKAADWKTELEALAEELEKGSTSAFERARDRLATATGLLAALNPENPLKRGFAILYKGEKRVGSVESCRAGEKIFGRLADGALIMTIDAKEKFAEEE